MTWRPFGRVAPLQGRVSRALALRQAAHLDLPVWLVRVMALPVLLTVFAASQQRLPALACALPALVMTAVWTVQRRRYAAESTRSDPYRIVHPRLPSTRRQRRIREWSAASDILSAHLLVFASAWLIRDLPAGLQYGTLLAAEALLVVIALRVVLDPDWYRPGESFPVVVDRLRAWCGVLCAAVSTGVALLGHVTVRPGELTDLAVVCAITATPLIVSAFTVAQDHLLVHATAMIRQEAQDGRQSVLDETHGALSTTLRLLEQRTRDQRAVAPQLYELAVIANAGLRETLTLADPDQETPEGPDTLRSIVATLALSVGAAYTMQVELRQLDPADRNVARVVLNELVGVALASGTTSVKVEVGLVAGTVQVSVSCAPPQRAAGGPAAEHSASDAGEAELSWLNSRLARVAGAAQTCVLDARLCWSARWRAGPRTLRLERKHDFRRRLLHGGAIPEGSASGTTVR